MRPLSLPVMTQERTLSLHDTAAGGHSEYVSWDTRRSLPLRLQCFSRVLPAVHFQYEGYSSFRVSLTNFPHKSPFLFQCCASGFQIVTLKLSCWLASSKRSAQRQLRSSMPRSAASGTGDTGEPPGDTQVMQCTIDSMAVAQQLNVLANWHE